jgi:hypothetical protein
VLAYDFRDEWGVKMLHKYQKLGLSYFLTYAANLV